MSEAKHTPGPYHVEGGSIWAEAPDGSNLKIATTHPVMSYVSVAERNANANLFAASPDLLDACKRLIETMDFWRKSYPKVFGEHTGAVVSPQTSGNYIKAVDAIANAEGRS